MNYREWLAAKEREGNPEDYLLQEGSIMIPDRRQRWRSNLIVAAIAIAFVAFWVLVVSLSVGAWAHLPRHVKQESLSRQMRQGSI